MPCHVVVFETATRTRSEHTCDEENTARIVEDDHAAKSTGEYRDLAGETFAVDWTRSRLVSFQRKREDGTVVASGGADGTQTPVC